MHGLEARVTAQLVLHFPSVFIRENRGQYRISL